MKKKVLLTSALTIILCLCLIAGSTFALFTSTASVNISVTSGTVDVDASIAGWKTWSLGETEANDRGGRFANGGAVALENGKLFISKMTPGDVVKLTINVENKSDVAVKYAVKASTTGGLSEALVSTVTIDNTELVMQKGNRGFETSWADCPTGTTQIVVLITFPNGTAEHDNQFQGKDAEISLVVEAVQANGVDANGNLITP